LFLFEESSIGRASFSRHVAWLSRAPVRSQAQPSRCDGTLAEITAEWVPLLAGKTSIIGDERRQTLKRREPVAFLWEELTLIKDIKGYRYCADALPNDSRASLKAAARSASTVVIDRFKTQTW